MTDRIDIGPTINALDSILAGSSARKTGLQCRQVENRHTFALYFLCWSAYNPNADMLIKIMARCFHSGILDYFMAIYVKKRGALVYDTAMAMLKSEGMNATGDYKTKDVDPRANSGFTLENSQTVLMLYTWLAAMGLLVFVHLLERTILRRFAGGKGALVSRMKSGGTVKVLFIRCEGQQN